jgi:hypothetical protein
MFQRLFLTIVFAFLALAATGCSTTRSTAQAQDSANPAQVMYPVSAEKADSILIQAMNAQFPNASIVRVELPYKGYFLTQRLLLDSHDFTARMIPAKGIGDAGKVVDGYTFEVIDQGTTIMISFEPVRNFVCEA